MFQLSGFYFILEGFGPAYALQLRTFESLQNPNQKLSPPPQVPTP